MKPASPELDALLSGPDPFRFVDLYTFKLRDGSILRYSAGDLDVTFEGQTYTARGPLVSGGRLRLVCGLEVDTCAITVTPGPTETLHGLALIVTARLGWWDRARATVRRAFLADWAAPPVGALLTFAGLVTDAQPEGMVIKLQVKSDLILLNQPAPVATYQATCTHAFGDARCGVHLDAIAQTGTVQTGSTAALLRSSLPAGFDLGVVTMTSGRANGLRRTVASAAAGELRLVAPLPVTPAAGDSFKVTPGCARTYAACQAHGNTGRFRGFRTMPVPEAVL